MLKGHGGNIYDLAEKLGCEASEIIDMSSNLNPLGPPPGLTDYLASNIDVLRALPEVDAKRASLAFAERHGLIPGRVMGGNGTTQFIHAAPGVLGIKKALILAPTYADYADACEMHNIHYEFLISEESTGFRPDIGKLHEKIKNFDTIFICNPNNPTGSMIPADELEPLCWFHPEKRFIIDESYMPFVKNGGEDSMLSCGLSNVLVLSSMSKIFGIPGLRIGFLNANETIIEKFMRQYQPWSMNSLAQAAVIYLMEQEEDIRGFVEKTTSYVETEKKRLVDFLGGNSNIAIFPSHTSFVLGRLSKHASEEVCDALAKEKILIRNCSNFTGLSNRHIRISLKEKQVNLRLAQKLIQCIS